MALAGTLGSAAPVLAGAPPDDPAVLATQPAAGPQSTSAQANAPVSPPAPPSCEADRHCPYPGSCQAGQCRIPPIYIDRLREEGQAHPAAGAIVLAVGGILTLAGVGLLAAGGGVMMHGRSVTDGTLEAGWSLAGVGVGGLVAGTILLGVGQWKLARWRAHHQASLTPLGLRLRF